jgi:hypothetical protein
MRPGNLSVAIVLTAAVLVSACSSATLSNGAALAKTGQAAATQMEQAATLSAATYTALKNAVTFDAGFANDIDDPDTQDFLKQEAQIQTALSAYGTMLEKLGNAYAALGALSSYDANGTFSSATSSLCGAASNLVASMPKSGSTSTNICQGASFGIGQIASAFQAHQVVDASNEIEAVLNAVIPVLSDPDRRNLIVLNGQLVQRQIVSAAKDLYASGIFSCGPLLTQLGAPLNLAPVSGADGIVAKHVNVQRGCLAVVSGTAQDSVNAVGPAYDKSVAALSALRDQHEKLKAGVPLDLDTINMILANLQGAAAKLQPPKGK